MVDRPHLGPAQVEPRNGLLDQVVGAVFITAEQVRDPPQRREPRRDVLDVLLLGRLHTPSVHRGRYGVPTQEASAGSPGVACSAIRMRSSRVIGLSFGP